MRTVRPSAALFVTALLAFLSTVARADGFIVIHDGPTVPGHFTFAPLEVVYHHVTVDVQDQVATTAVDQEFYNPNGRQLEGTYLFPLPPGSHIDKFSMDINGKMMDAELLSADKARSIYEEIVRKAKDPALLEYVGRDAFKVRIFPIEPNSKKHIKISYTQLLKSDTGLTEYVYPLNTEKFSSKPLSDVSIKVNLSCNQPLKSLYSPSHNVEIRRDGDRKAVVGYEERNVRPDTDFKLIFTRDSKDIGINLLTYKSGNSDGYFLLMASPGNGSKDAAIQPKDICFVLDTSGSMAGKKMDQARKALNFCVNNLNETDRFEVIRFSTETEPFFDKLVPASKTNIEKATKFVDALKATGATAIDEAMKKSLSYPHDEKRPFVIVFLTDGQPTIGETREDAIVGNIQKISSSIRIFPFGIGTDVNTHLLDRIADGTNAASAYVLPDEDIELKVSNFFTKIKEPALSNLALSFEGSEIRTSQLYPSKLPDLFKGQMLVAFGRYTGKGPAAVKISGMQNGEKKEYASDVSFTNGDTSNAFIPRLWAQRRVGWLLDEIRMHGESTELKDEVVRLAREHGIVTPYTAYLIIEDESKRGVPVASRNFREMEQDRTAVANAKQFYDSAKAEASREGLRSGNLAVANTGNLTQMRIGDNTSVTQNGMGLDKSGTGTLTANAQGWVLNNGVLMNGGNAAQPVAAAPTAMPTANAASNLASNAPIGLNDQAGRNINSVKSLTDVNTKSEAVATGPVPTVTGGLTGNGASVNNQAQSQGALTLSGANTFTGGSTVNAATNVAAGNMTLNNTAGAGGVNSAPSTQPVGNNFGYRQAQNYTQQVRVLNGRAFYQNGDTWTDSGVQGKKDPKKVEIKFNSDEYFKFMSTHPEAVPWLSLGNNVDLLIDEVVYSIR